MSADAPVVTVLIPAREEALDLPACLAAVLAQDHPLEQVEIIVVDGGSRDETGDVARRVLSGAPVGRSSVVENPVGTTPSNLNAGLAQATGTYLCRVDARSIIPPDYVGRCVAVLGERPEVAVVGGSQVAQARDGTARAGGIARAMNNGFGMGFSRYRRGAASGATDTVYLGAFRTAELRAVGGWDERLTTNQDFDLNRRMGASGLVWFEAELPVAYLPRSDVGAVLAQYHRFGRWKVRYWRWTGNPPERRQLAILVGGPALALGAALISRGRPRRVAALAAVGLAGAAAVEQVGSSPDSARSPGARAYSVATLMAVWTGWLSGVARELATARLPRS